MNKHSMVSFHNHAYSFSDSIIEPKEYVKQAAMLNSKSIGISEHGTLCSWLDFQSSMKKADLKPIAAVEFYFMWSDDPKNKKSHHILLVALNDTGYRNLLKLIHISNTSHYYMRPRIDEKVLFANKEGLACGSACLSSPITSRLLAGDDTGARVAAMQFKREFGDLFFMEVFPHDLAIQAEANLKVIQLAKDLQIPLNVSLDVHFIDKSYEEIYLINGRNRRNLTKDDVDGGADCLISADFHFKDCDTIVDSLVQHGMRKKDVLAAFDYSIELDKKINFDFNDHYELPMISQDPDNELEKLLGKKLIEKFGKNVPKEYKERLRYEFNIIKEKKFSQYFHLLYDIIKYCHENDFKLGCARGSSGGCLIAYILEITDLDPILYNLPFERFQNPNRSSMLDIDVDLSPAARPKVIQYLKDKYGEENVVQICTLGQVKAKAAIKDVSRYMGIPFAEVNKITALIPSLSYDDEGALVDVELTEAIKIPEVAAYKDKYSRLFELALQLEGSYKGFGVHAGGVVILPAPAAQIIPVMQKKGEDGAKNLISGWDKKGLEKIGLVKLDLLGLQTLDVLAECERLTGVKTKDISFDDIKTWKFLQESKFNLGLFQLVAPRTKKYLRDSKVDSIISLSHINTGIRPGSDWVTFEKNKKANVIKPHFDLPIFRETLKETYGAMLYQDDLMFIISNVSDFNLGEADLLRRALEKNNKEEIEKYKVKFIETCKYPDKAEEIFLWLGTKVGYAFPKSHSVAYSINGYYTAWYKANYPLEFLTANIMNPKSNNEYSESEYVGMFVNEAQKMGMDVQLPQLGFCYTTPTIKYGTVYLGLDSVKGITKKTADILSEINTTNLLEFIEKSGEYQTTTKRTKLDGSQSIKTQISKSHILSLIRLGFFPGTTKENLETFNTYYKAKEKNQFVPIDVEIDEEDAVNQALGFSFYDPLLKYVKNLDSHYQDDGKWLVMKVLECKTGKSAKGWEWQRIKAQSPKGIVTAFISGGMPSVGEIILANYKTGKSDALSIISYKLLD